MAKEVTIQDNAIQDKAICFGEKLAASATFKVLFCEGMALVEETAAYLDGDGRQDAKMLPRMAALAYASESMRLTTRLMQIASWLLLQRAVNEGEMTQAEVSSDKKRTRIAWQQPPSAANAVDVLPVALCTLIEKSQRLQDRIVRLDGMMGETHVAATIAAGPHPLQAQMSLLQQAFGG